MARGFRTRRVTVDGRRERRYAAHLDPDERALVAGLLAQVADLIGAPEGTGADGAAEPTDEFEAIIAGLGMDMTPDPADGAGAGGGGAGC